MNYFMEIVKMWVGCMFWVKIVKQFNLENFKFMVLCMYSQIFGWSFIEQDFFNNVGCIVIEVLVVMLGGIQFLYINSLDEVIVLFMDFFVKIVCDIQIYFQKELDIIKVVDFWAGFYYVEYLINELVNCVWKLIEEVEELGGMVKVIEDGLFKFCIEEVVV